jgi:hypothetical protein
MNEVSGNAVADAIKARLFNMPQSPSSCDFAG